MERKASTCEVLEVLLCSFLMPGRDPQRHDDILVSPQLDCIGLFHLLAQPRRLRVESSSVFQERTQREMAKLS